jgi:hypothetical protein
MFIKIARLSIVFMLWNVTAFSFAGGMTQTSKNPSAGRPFEETGNLPVEESSGGAPIGANAPAAVDAAAPPRTPPARGEEVMKALSAAHPKRVGPAVFRDGDWAAEVRGQWFYYADGRFLPEHLRSKAEEYDRLPFYPYPEDMPVWEPPSAEDAARFRESAANRQSRPSKRSTFFFDALWNVRTRAEAWEQVKTLRFLGKDVLVHHAILEELAMVEQSINRLAGTNAEVRNWLKSVTTITAWNWRNIADIQSRSNHAYGIAIDVLPASGAMRGLETYWLWTAQKHIDWWAVPYKSRYQPPDAVVKAFERYGFIWGGKWTFYDTMHFEYRPELLLLSGVPVNGAY